MIRCILGQLPYLQVQTEGHLGDLGTFNGHRVVLQVTPDFMFARFVA
jgi:hypothetical protein